MNTLTVGNIDLTATYGLYVDSSMSYNKPKKNVETVNVPGRNGNLVVDYGTYQNITITYPCYIKGNFDTKFATMINKLSVLTGYQKITCSNDSGHYREGIFLTENAPTVKRLNKDGYFDLVFNCKPQRFDNWTWATDAVTLSTSPTEKDQIGEQTAKPLLQVQGTGTIVFQTVDTYGTPFRTITATIDTTALTNPPLYIDCDSMECYTDTPLIEAHNECVSFSPNVFPDIPSGYRTYVTASGLTTKKLVWRDWTL